MQNDIEYEKNNVGFDDIYPEKTGGGIKCKNYYLCRTVLPTSWFEYKGNYLCTNCDMMFGTWKKDISDVLDIGNNTECPICLEVKHSISQPNCNHRICFDCFKKCYFKSGEDSEEEEDSKEEEEYTEYIQKCPLCLK